MHSVSPGRAETEISEAEAVFLSAVEKVPVYELDVFQSRCVSCFRHVKAFTSLYIMGGSYVRGPDLRNLLYVTEL